MGKAVLQSATNVGRVLLQTLKLDGGYDSEKVEIYPVIIVHDSLYNLVTLNYWVNLWFQQELNTMKATSEYQQINFSEVRPVTVIDIDTLIFYRTNFNREELDLYELVELYQQHVQFHEVGEDMDEKFGKAILPFADFARFKAQDRGIKVDFQLIRNVYNASGYVDQ